MRVGNYTLDAESHVFGMWSGVEEENRSESKSLFLGPGPNRSMFESRYQQLEDSTEKSSFAFKQDGTAGVGLTRHFVGYKSSSFSLKERSNDQLLGAGDSIENTLYAYSPYGNKASIEKEEGLLNYCSHRP